MGNSFPSRSDFQKIRKSIKKSPPNLDYLIEIVNIIDKNGKHPLILLPELYPGFEGKHFSIKFKEAKLLRNNLFGLELEPYEDIIVPVAAPGLLYSSDPDNEELVYLLFLLELFSHQLILNLLRDTELPYGIFIGSHNLTINEYLWEWFNLCSESYCLNDGKVLIIVNGKALRGSHTKEIPKDNLILDLIEFATGKKEEISQFFEDKEVPFRVISSPLAKKIPPQKMSAPSVSMKKIGMNELRASFVIKEDLMTGKEITDDDEKKLIWSSIEKKSRFESPLLQKGDILIPIKRQGALNVAIVCEEIPEYEFFIPKADIAIIRLNPEKFSFKEMERLGKLLMAEFRNSPSDKFLSINDLRNILLELFFFEDLEKILKEEELEELIKKGRKLIRRKITKYLMIKKLVSITKFFPA